MALPKLLKKSLPSIFDGKPKAQAGERLIPNEDRHLSLEEQKLLTHLLDLDPATRGFIAQLPFTRVTGGCKCGCPTIDLSVSKEAPLASASQRVIVDVEASVREKPVGILVFADEGKLSLLEVYDCTGEIETPFPLPSIESIGMWRST